MAKKLLFVDLETVPDESRSHLWAAKEQELKAGGKEFVPALLPEFCQIVAMGWAINNAEPQSLVTGLQRQSHQHEGLIEPTETTILNTFWWLVAQGNPVLVGFNILSFDLPVAFVRSALLKIKPTRLIDRKPWSNDCVDLLSLRRYTNGGGRLKDLAECLGFDVPCADVDGSQVSELMATDPQRVAAYVESDVAVTRQLYHFYKGYFVEDFTQ